MRLVIKTGANCRRENLLTSDKIAIILPDKYKEASKRDIILIICNLTCIKALLTYINITHIIYMPLYYVFLFLYSKYKWHYSLTLR